VVCVLLFQAGRERASASTPVIREPIVAPSPNISVVLADGSRVSGSDEDNVAEDAEVSDPQNDDGRNARNREPSPDVDMSVLPTTPSRQTKKRARICKWTSNPEVQARFERCRQFMTSNAHLPSRQRLSTTAILRKFNIPKSSWYWKKKDKNNRRVGRPALLSKKEENDLVTLLTAGCNWDVFLTRQNITQIVANYIVVKKPSKINELSRQLSEGEESGEVDVELVAKTGYAWNGKEDYVPGRHWFANFLRRNPTLKLRHAKARKYADGLVKKEDIEE
jgi:hypothetical protein